MPSNPLDGLADDILPEKEDNIPEDIRRQLAEAAAALNKDFEHYTHEVAPGVGISDLMPPKTAPYLKRDFSPEVSCLRSALKRVTHETPISIGRFPTKKIALTQMRKFYLARSKEMFFRRHLEYDYWSLTFTVRQLKTNEWTIIATTKADLILYELSKDNLT